MEWMSRNAAPPGSLYYISSLKERCTFEVTLALACHSYRIKYIPWSPKPTKRLPLTPSSVITTPTLLLFIIYTVLIHLPPCPFCD